MVAGTAVDVVVDERADFADLREAVRHRGLQAAGHGEFGPFERRVEIDHVQVRDHLEVLDRALLADRHVVSGVARPPGAVAGQHVIGAGEQLVVVVGTVFLDGQVLRVGMLRIAHLPDADVAHALVQKHRLTGGLVDDLALDFRGRGLEVVDLHAGDRSQQHRAGEQYRK